MLKKILIRLKPGASRNVHLFASALLWTAIGIMLMTRAMIWLVGVHRLWLIAPAVVLGSLKSVMVLDKTAKKSLKRILHLTDGTCLGAIYSTKTWLLVMVMMVAGITLRHSSLPHSWLGLLYMTIGWGLFLSSRHAWVCWRHEH